MMTVITQVFGVRGEMGDLLFDPKLLQNQFDNEGNASLNLQFAGKDFCVQYHNPDMLDYDAYKIGTISINGVNLSAGADRIPLSEIQKMGDGKQVVDITLIAK